MARDLDKICDWIEEQGFKLNVKKVKAIYGCVKEKESPFSRNHFVW